MPVDSSNSQPQAGAAPAKTIGRPSTYRDEYAVWGERFAKLGATLEEMADAFGVAPSTVSRWLVTLPAFQEAVKRGRTEADARVAESLWCRATGAVRARTQKPVVLKEAGGGQRIEIVEYEEAYPPDTVAAIFWLKNRQPANWRDKQDLDVSLTGRVARIPDDERTQKALELLKRLAGNSSPAIEAGPVIDVEPSKPDGDAA